MKIFWNYYKKSFFNTIVVIICFLILFLSNIVVRQFNKIYDLNYHFLYIFFLNYQSIVYFFVLLLNSNGTVAISALKFNYLIGFIAYALCIILVIIERFFIDKVNVLIGAVPLGVYLTLGSVFLLHGLNYLLYLRKEIITIILLFSYCMFFCIQLAFTLTYHGSINIYITPVFFVIWVLLFVWISDV